MPPPYFHLLRYFGVLSSHSGLRKEVVPRPPHDPSATAPPPAPGDQLELALDAVSDEPTGRRRWAWLLRHVFAADLDTCPRCSGPMRWLQAATTHQCPPPARQARARASPSADSGTASPRPARPAARSVSRPALRPWRVCALRSATSPQRPGSSMMRRLFPTRTSPPWAPPPRIRPPQRPRRFPSSIFLRA